MNGQALIDLQRDMTHARADDWPKMQPRIEAVISGLMDQRDLAVKSLTKIEGETRKATPNLGRIHHNAKQTLKKLKELTND